MQSLNIQSKLYVAFIIHSMMDKETDANGKLNL